MLFGKPVNSKRIKTTREEDSQEMGSAEVKPQSDTTGNSEASQAIEDYQLQTEGQNIMHFLSLSLAEGCTQDEDITSQEF